MKTQRIKKSVVAKIQTQVAKMFEKAVNPADPILGWGGMSLEQKLEALADHLQELREKLAEAVNHNKKYRSSYLWSNQNMKKVACYADLDLTYWLDGSEILIECGAPNASCRHLYYRSRVLKDGAQTTFATVNAHVRQIDAYLATIKEILAIADDEITNSVVTERSKKFAAGEMIGLDVSMKSNGPPMDPSPHFDPLQDMTL